MLSFDLLKVELYESPYLRPQPALRMHLICVRGRMVLAGEVREGGRTRAFRAGIDTPAYARAIVDRLTYNGYIM